MDGCLDQRLPMCVGFWYVCVTCQYMRRARTDSVRELRRVSDDDVAFERPHYWDYGVFCSCLFR